MKCLDCGQEMAAYEVQTNTAKAVYDVCEACGGLWLDKGQLDKVAFQVDGDIEYCSTEDAEAPAAAPDKLCPRCTGEHLQRVKFLGDDKIVLQHCPNCLGFWLDGGQIGQIDDELAKIMPVKSKGFSEFLANTHLPHFNYRKRDSAETDFTVPVLPLPEATPEGTTLHKCPACGLFLDAWKIHGIGFETCPGCAGLWLHEKQLKALKDQTDDGDLRWMDDEIAAIEKTSAMISDKRCPECADCRLLSTHFGNSGITIDRCDHCRGVWLERGEFEGMAGYLHEELDHESSADLRKEVVKDVKAVFTDKSRSKLAEVRDAKSAISALINTSIFEHPALAEFLLNANKAERVIGGN